MKAARKRVLDEDLSKVGTALRRAARRARQMAEQTRTPLVIYEHGRVIRTRPPRRSQAVRHRAPDREAAIRRIKSLFQMKT
jgi:hypothetical protein